MPSSIRSWWLIFLSVGVLAACGSTPGTASKCAQAVLAAEAPRYHGELVTSVNGQSVSEPMDLQIVQTRSGISLQLSPPTPQGAAQDAGCILTASGTTVGSGACQALSSSTGSTIVLIDGGTIARSSDDTQLRLSIKGKLHVLEMDTSEPAPPLPVDWQFAGVKQPPQPPPVGPSGPPVLKMSFAGGGFLDAPFPNPMRARDDGTVDVSGFPDPTPPPMQWYDVKAHIVFGVLKNIVAMLRTMGSEHGFGVSSGVLFQSTTPLRPLDSTKIHRETTDDFVLVPVTETKPGQWRLGTPHPIRVGFHEAAGSLAPANVLTLLPLQGVPMVEDTLYLAFVRRGVAGAQGTLEASPEMARLAGLVPGAPLPKDIRVEYAHAVDALRAANVALDSIAAMTVFPTGHPSADLRAYFANVKARMHYATHFKLAQDGPEFCAYEAKADVPVFQTGKAPYQVGKGIDWLLNLIPGVTSEGTLDPNGKFDTKQSRVVLTVPKTNAAPARWPTAVFIRAGAGLLSYDSPLVDRGPTLPSGIQSTGCLPREDGSAPPSSQTCRGGPAREFARAGVVGITVDGPQTGSRLETGSGLLAALAPQCGIPAGSGEDNAMFDVCNPRAITDNIRESAIEAALIPDLLDQPIVVDGADTCHLRTAKFETHRVALMGHSMGATIAPLALSLQPRFAGVVLSGANGSYIENILAKERPTSLASTLEGLLGLNYCLDEFGLLPSLFQWAEERSDPAVYEPRLFDRARGARPPDSLMVQGIGDHYVPSPVANVSSVALGVDLAGPYFDNEAQRKCPNPSDDVPPLKCPLTGELRYPLSPVLPLLEAFKHKDWQPIPPQGVSDNRSGSTGAVVQYRRDAQCRQDGHEVAYEIAKARWQYRCFLRSFAKGKPRVFTSPDGDPKDDTKEIDTDCPQEAR